MKLNRLKLENFRQYRDQTLTFREGMTAIVGANGSGKTTILEAIVFALYGAQRKTGSGARTKRDDLRFYWAEPRSKLRVVLEFEFDGKVYELERSEKSASLAEIHGDKALIKATGLSEVKWACEKLLRLTYEQFKNSFCAEQKSLAFLQFQTDTRKQEQVAKMLGFDRLRTAGEIARQRGREFRVMASTLESRLGDGEQLRSQIETASAEVKTARQKIEDGERRVNLVESQLAPAAQLKSLAEQFEKIGRDMDVLAERSSQLKKAREAALTGQAEAKAQVVRFTELTPVAMEFEALEVSLTRFAEWEKENLARRRDQETLERRMALASELTKEIDALNLPDLQALRGRKVKSGLALEQAECERQRKHGEWVQLVAATRQAEATANESAVRIRRELERTEDLVKRGICPECGQPAGKSSQAKLTALRGELAAGEASVNAAKESAQAAQAKPIAVEEAEKRIAQAKEADAAAQAALEAGIKALAEVAGKKDRLAETQQEIDQLVAALSKGTERYDAKAHEIARQRHLATKPDYHEWVRFKSAPELLAKAEAALSAIQRDFDKAHAEYLDLKRQRSELPFASGEEAVAAVRRYGELSAELQVARAELGAAETAEKTSKERLKEAEQRLKEYHEGKELLKQTNREATTHESVAREMASLREELNAAILPELEARASDIIVQLTGGRYQQLLLDEDFNATVVDDEVSKHVISGGEEDVVALALRLALSELIQERQGRPMSLLILDEVFGSLDAERRQAVLERLQAIKGRFAQILVISHIEDINQVADQCIFLRRDEKSRSTVIGDLPLEDERLLLA